MEETKDSAMTEDRFWGMIGVGGDAEAFDYGRDVLKENIYD
jgi:hypothetical protein